MLPWSLKAGELVPASTRRSGAAAVAGLTAASGALDAARDRGRGRGRAATARTAARQRRRSPSPPRTGPTSGRSRSLADVRLAPFQLLAGSSGHLLRRGTTSGTWKRRNGCAAADPLFAAHPARRGRPGRPGRRCRGDRLVAGAHRGRRRGHGGQASSSRVTRGKRGIAQAGSSAAGRSTCGSSTGPSTCCPANLDRLRERNLGRKRSLAASEFALGLEALDRFVRRGAAVPGARVRVRRAGPGKRAGRPPAVRESGQSGAGWAVGINSLAGALRAVRLSKCD